MENRVVITDPVPERGTAVFTATFVDENGNVVSDANLSSLVITVYALDIPNEPIINNLDHISVLNENNGTVSSSGEFKLVLTGADLQILSPLSELEMHRLLIEWTYGDNNKPGKFEIDFPVRNLKKVQT